MRPDRAILEEERFERGRRTPSRKTSSMKISQAIGYFCKYALSING
jgi:hypothetical protein